MGAEELLLKEACPCFTGKELSVLLTIGWAKNSGREANEVGQRPMAGHCLQVSALNKPLLARSCNSEQCFKQTFISTILQLRGKLA